MLTSMYRIKQISRQILLEKAEDTAAPGDTSAKRDVMSLLVRAQSTSKGEGYHMSDAAMVDQVLTFLGAGHETTASGLAWVSYQRPANLLLELKCIDRRSGSSPSIRKLNLSFGRK